MYELTGDLPCRMSLWHAKDAVEFQSMIDSQGLETLRRTYSVRSCIEALMNDDFDTLHLASFRELTISDLTLLQDGKNSFPRSQNEPDYLFNNF